MDFRCSLAGFSSVKGLRFVWGGGGGLWSGIFLGEGLMLLVLQDVM